MKLIDSLVIFKVFDIFSQFGGKIDPLAPFSTHFRPNFMTESVNFDRFFGATNETFPIFSSVLPISIDFPSKLIGYLSFYKPISPIFRAFHLEKRPKMKLSPISTPIRPNPIDFPSKIAKMNWIFVHFYTNFTNFTNFKTLSVEKND